MSSNIQSAKHYNSIANKLQTLAQFGDMQPFPYSVRDMYPALYSGRHYSEKVIKQQVCELVDTIRELNVLCVMLQYKHHYPGTLDSQIAIELQAVKASTDTTPLTDVSLMKALQCSHYQIESQHLKELRGLTQAEDNALFFLREMVNHIAVGLAMKLPEYDKAPWGI